MTDTTTLEGAPPARRSGSLSALKLAELQGLASSMGISGTAKMRKSDLVEAIKAKQGGTGNGSPQAPERRSRRAERPAGPGADAPTDGEPSGRDEQERAERTQPEGTERAEPTRPERAERAEPTRPERAERGEPDRAEQPRIEQGGREGRADRAPRTDDRRQGEDRTRPDRDRGDRPTSDQDRRDDQQGRQERTERPDRQNTQGQQGSGQQASGQGAGQQASGQQGQADPAGAPGQGDDDDEAGRGGRRRRNRNRNRDKRRGGRTDYVELDGAESHVTDDDVLLPVAGILDILDNYAFVRTTGYLPGPGDVYVPLGMVKRSGLRKGDAVTGAIKAPRDGEPQAQPQPGSRQKFNPLVRLDSVNGMTLDEAHKRPEFGKLTPLYPQDRLRLETDAGLLTTRIIDLVAPIGKGQRGLIVAPAKAGKTMVMQAIANAITTNNPEVHLMVVLVDERPEEVTDMQRAVKGEVIASTFDRPADDHTTVAELSIERAKRLVELGHDVVVLLDSITKLGRAYNLSAPASGRILSGGVDSAALYPPKKFFGAARNIENGGSLTILATALVETGSRMDEVIFEEFKGTGNMELKLDRGLSNRRIFPAVDINNSGTRREEILLAPEELRIMWKLRRVLAALDSQQGIELLLDRLRKTKSNYEFLMQVQQNSSIKLDDEDDD